jgi:hypothetical protein
VEAELDLVHPDAPPVGNVGGLMQALAAEAEEAHVRFEYRYAGDALVVDTAELQAELGEVPLTAPPVLHWLLGYVNHAVESLRLGDK